MKKLLIISYYFNQEESIGSIRIKGLAKYISQFGWEPTIITVKSNNYTNNNFKTIETEYLDLREKWKSRFNLKENIELKNQIKSYNLKNKRKFFYLLNYIWTEIFAYPDEKKNWMKPAIEKAIELIENENFKAIISSSYPYTTHLIANELTKKYNIPWIADLRDLWIQNPYFNHCYARKYFEKKLELKTLKNSTMITTVSKPLEDNLSKIHKNKKIVTILNGFDPDLKIKSIPLDKKFTITYAGTLYNGKRDPKKLFIALNELISEKKINVKDLSIDFYGPIEDWLIKDIQKYKLSEVVNLIGIIPRRDVLKIQRKSQLLLLLTWENPKEYGIIPGKVFEYLAAKRPIISIGFDKGPLQDIIKSTNSGIHTSDIKEIKKFIEISYNEFKINNYLKYNGIESKINQYSQVNMTKKFADILNKIS